MWSKIAHYIIRYRLVWLGVILISTAFMGYEGSKIELSYQFARILPANDPIEKEYQDFRKLFGEDGGVMVIGWQDEGLFELNKFKDWNELSQQIKATEGIKNVLSLGSLYKVLRNDSLSQFDFSPIMKQLPATQAEMDSLKKEVINLPFYEGLLFNKTSGSIRAAVYLKKEIVNTAQRKDFIIKK